MNDRRQASATPSRTPAGSHEEARAGKETLVGRALGDEEGRSPRQQLEHAAAKATAPLPHLDKIQRAFGKHDVTHARTVEDRKAAHAVGAEAAAVGDRAVFDGSPSLHTAAHEAAHIVQQKAGVQLRGGIGKEGDPYERHADAVADRVVAGQSAEELLDQHAGPGSSGGPAVQLAKIKVPGRDRPVGLATLGLKEVEALIEVLEGNSMVDHITYTLDDFETAQDLLEHAKKHAEVLRAKTETKPFDVASRAKDLDKPGLVITNDMHTVGIAQKRGFHVAMNEQEALGVFGASIAKSAGGKCTQPDAWVVVYEQRVAALFIKVFGHMSDPMRGERKKAAPKKTDKEILRNKGQNPWTQKLVLKGPCKKGKTSPSKDSAMGGYTARNYAIEAGVLDAAEKQTWDWLHLIGHAIGGHNALGNLVAGTFDSNTGMIPFEKAVIAYCKSGAVTPSAPAIYTVTVKLLEDTWVADEISMTLEHKQQVIKSYKGLSGLQTSKMSRIEYDIATGLLARMGEGSSKGYGSGSDSGSDSDSGS